MLNSRLFSPKLLLFSVSSFITDGTFHLLYFPTLAMRCLQYYYCCSVCCYFSFSGTSLWITEDNVWNMTIILLTPLFCMLNSFKQQCGSSYTDCHLPKLQVALVFKRSLPWFFSEWSYRGKYGLLRPFPFLAFTIRTNSGTGESGLIHMCVKMTILLLVINQNYNYLRKLR